MWFVHYIRDAYRWNRNAISDKLATFDFTAGSILLFVGIAVLHTNAVLTALAFWIIFVMAGFLIGVETVINRINKHYKDSDPEYYVSTVSGPDNTIYTGYFKYWEVGIDRYMSDEERKARINEIYRSDYTKILNDKEYDHFSISTHPKIISMLCDITGINEKDLYQIGKASNNGITIEIKKNLGYIRNTCIFLTIPGLPNSKDKERLCRKYQYYELSISRN